MTDFSELLNGDVGSFVSTAGPNCMLADAVLNTASAFNSSAVWPAINRACYCPIWLAQQVTVFKMSFIVATQSGNYDVGIYDEAGHRLVSKGSTAVPVAGIALVDITDTVIGPGTYFLAMNVDNTTASVRRSNLGTILFRASGLLQQDVGAIALPDPFTGAAPVSAYVPLLTAHFKAIA